MKEKLNKLGLFEVSCDCEKCQNMCKGPCCGSIEDMKKIIEAGYGDRLMLDDVPGPLNQQDELKPALKGYEGKVAPWHLSSEEGCTFWKKGKCELHESGLKPIGGKVAIHSDECPTAMEELDFTKVFEDEWKRQEAKELIELWKRNHLKK